jgi:hypothetical protein
LGIDFKSSWPNSRKIGYVEEILEGNSSKDWSKRQEGEIRICRMPPKRLVELGEIMAEAVSKWNLIEKWWKVDFTL